MLTIRRSLFSATAIASAVGTVAAERPDMVPALTVSGRGPATFVLQSGMVGGVAEYRRLEARVPGGRACWRAWSSTMTWDAIVIGSGFGGAMAALDLL